MGCISKGRCRCWQRRRSRGQNWSDFGWALKLRVAFCKVNLILCSLRLSIRGADPHIDDQTPLSCLGKQPTHNPHSGQSCGEIQSMQKALLKKKEKKRAGDTSGYSVQWGPHWVKTQVGGPADSTAIFIPGKVPFTLNEGIALFTLCKNISSEKYSCTVSIVARFHFSQQHDVTGD